MKEATGELNMTVVTVVAIAALVAFFYLIIWPVVQVQMTLTTACSAAGGGTTTQTMADGSTIVCDGAQCTYTPTDGGAATTKQCS